MMLSFIPIAILAVACVAVYLFPIDERVHAANVARIAERTAKLSAVPTPDDKNQAEPEEHGAERKHTL